MTPDPGRLETAGLTPGDLRSAIARNNRNVGVGRLEQGVDALIVRVEGRLRDSDALRDLVVAEREGFVVRVGDVADVVTDRLTRYGGVTRDGVETAQGLVVSLRDSDTGEVAALVKERLAEITPSLPRGTQINVFYDRAELIEGAVGTMSRALLQAVVLVVVLLALFLGNLRAAATVALSLPMAALATFLLMRLTGQTANLMSLGGLVIAIGMLVDSSVVVVENVLSRMDNGSALPRPHVVYRAATEVARPVVAGCIIVVLVFAPLLGLQGLEGKLFSPVALTIVYAMLSALLFALLVVPFLAGLLLRGGGVATPRFMRHWQRLYRDTLNAVLQRPLFAALPALILLLASAAVTAMLGRIFLPVLDEGDIIVQFEKSPSISLAASLAIDQQVERAMLRDVPEIRQVVARTGSDELGLDPMSLNETDVFMQLEPPGTWRAGGKAALVQAIRAVIEEFPGMSYGFTQPIQMRVSEMLTGRTGDVAVKIFGDDLRQLGELLDRAAGLVASLDGAVDLQKSLAESDAFLNLRPRAPLAASQALTSEDLAQSLSGVFEGERIGTLRNGRRRIPIVFAQGDSGRPASAAGLAGERITTPEGAVVSVGSVVAMSEQPGPVLIEREQGSRYAALSVNVRDRDVAGFVLEARQLLKERLALPSGYRLEFGGEFENQQRATTRLLILVPFVLSLILVILFATFRSLALAVLVLVNIPFALMGGVAALFAAGEYLSVPASVGLIALLGVAVLNAVVMISYLQQLRQRTISITDCILDGAVQRLRPILMTATTAMFGLVPLVFATGPGAELQRPLAIVVIGGLFTSTLTTLYLLPVCYQFVEARRP